MTCEKSEKICEKHKINLEKEIITFGYMNKPIITEYCAECVKEQEIEKEKLEKERIDREKKESDSESN
jgi:uncharacterized protein YlaI